MRISIAGTLVLALAAMPVGAQKIDLHVIQESLTLQKSDITRAEAVNSDGQWMVHIYLAEPAALKFAEITARGRRKAMQIVVDDRIITAPIIIGAITGGQFIISGTFTEADARDLAAKFK